MYLFGSQLIKKYFSDFREPNDIDWVSNNLDLSKNSNSKEEFYSIPCTPSREMTIDEIFTLKVSHAIYDIHWKKTMSDIRFLQIKESKIIPEFLTNLRTHWENIHGIQKRTDFDVMPGDFFDDKVKRKLNHDELHKMINPSPTYINMIDNGVTPNMNKFEKLSEDSKTEVLFEEAFVIAIERFSNYPDLVAYQKAQQILVTRLHPIWLSDYIILNWNKTFWNPRLSKFYNTYLKIKNN